jgi:hypothetical protein
MMHIYTNHHSTHSAASSTGFRVFVTHCILDNGQILAITFPLINPIGSGPKVLESLDHGRLSPHT